MFLILAVLAVGVIYPWAKWFGVARQYVGVALACLVLLPYFVWEALFPPPFDITAYSDRIEYEFKDPVYAAEFAELNMNELIEIE